MNREDREGGRHREANGPGAGCEGVESAWKGSVKIMGRIERKGG